MDSYKQILSRFKPVRLEEMYKANLMQRYEVKYLFNISQLHVFLNRALDNYRVLEIDEKRIMGYENLYFDTQDHRMYLHHHNQKLNRHKIRIRHYRDTNDYFLEAKFKNNKGRTEKQRIPVDSFNSIGERDSGDFIVNNSPYSVNALEEKLSTYFHRISLVDIDARERITVDLDLKLFNDHSSFMLDYLVIAEVKHQWASANMGFKKLLQEERIFPKRISKYCLGTNLLYPDVKNNRFKPKILYLNKLDLNKQYDKLLASII